MRDLKAISLLMERIIHKYNQIELKSRDYGTGVSLTRVEIHTIVTVFENPGISITELAKKHGITKGAASQMIYKLVEKGMVVKRTSPDSDAQISVYVTEDGKTSYEGHKSYHRNNEANFYPSLREVSDETYDQMLQVLRLMEESIDEGLKK